MCLDQFVSRTDIYTRREMLQVVAACPQKLFSIQFLKQLHQLFIIVSHSLTIVAHVGRFLLKFALIDEHRKSVHDFIRCCEVLLLRALGAVKEHSNASLIVAEAVHDRDRGLMVSRSERFLKACSHHRIPLNDDDFWRIASC